MWVKALAGFCIGAGVDVAPGQVFEAEDARAREWIAVGHVEACAAPAVAKPAREMESDAADAGSDGESSQAHPDGESGTLDGGDPRPLNREPAPAAGRRRNAG